ncbi:MAG: hypothetical protein DRQ35_01705 [Gammaproteobacteria bacterium]|nr:MAG: hypothetical protein DRQ35_01705 [Gammaproteobacteria bacterium]
MNYNTLYNNIIDSVKDRINECYTEKHHIVPRSLGGSNDKDNIAILTAREHFICHYLLAKMYKKESIEWYKMNNAFMMMKCSSMEQTRYFNSKLYESLRINFSAVMSNNQKGKNNSQYGTHWYHNPTTLVCKKCLPENKPEGWVRGKVPKIETTCIVCNKNTGSFVAKWCDEHRKKIKTRNAAKGGKTYRDRKNNEDREKFTLAITTSKTWKEAIFKAGFKTDGYSRTRLQRFAKEENLQLIPA